MDKLDFRTEYVMALVADLDQTAIKLMDVLKSFEQVPPYPGQNSTVYTMATASWGGPQSEEGALYRRAYYLRIQLDNTLAELFTELGQQPEARLIADAALERLKRDGA